MEQARETFRSASLFWWIGWLPRLINDKNIVNVKCISMSTLENTNSNNYQNVPEHKADDYHDYERNDDNQSVTVH